MNIAVIAGTINNRSGSRAPLEIAKHLALLKHEVTVYASKRDQDPDTAHELSSFGVKMNTYKKSSLLGNYLDAYRLYFLLKNNNQQLCLFSATLPFFCASLLSRIPTVRLYQGTQFDALLEYAELNRSPSIYLRIANLFVNLIVYINGLISFRLSAKVIAISNYCAREGENLYKRKVDAIIYNGGNHLSPGKLPRSRKNKIITLLSVSRITPYKGFHLIIKALQRIQTRKRIVFVIAGSQPKKNYLKFLRDDQQSQSFSLKIAINISAAQLVDLYSDCQIYVNADRYLFFGLPIAEAAFFAKPTVSLKLAAAEELIDHGKTGYIAKDLTQLSYFLKLLINNPGKAQAMGRKARLKALHLFHWHAAALEYERFFKSMVGGTRNA